MLREFCTAMDAGDLEYGGVLETVVAGMLRGSFSASKPKKGIMSHFWPFLRRICTELVVLV